MCNFSNNNQQAQAINNSSTAAIKDSEKSGLYSPIPIAINIVIGDFNIFCNNEAYRRRDKAKPKKRGAKRINYALPLDDSSHNAPTTINQQNEEISGSKLYGMLLDALTPDRGAICKFSFSMGYLQLRTTKDFFSPTQSSLDEIIIGLRKETGDNKIKLSSVNYIKIRMDNMPKEYWYKIYRKLREKFGPYQIRIYL